MQIYEQMAFQSLTLLQLKNFYRVLQNILHLVLTMHNYLLVKQDHFLYNFLFFLDIHNLMKNRSSFNFINFSQILTMFAVPMIFKSILFLISIVMYRHWSR